MLVIDKNHPYCKVKSYLYLPGDGELSYDIYYVVYDNKDVVVLLDDISHAMGCDWYDASCKKYLSFGKKVRKVTLRTGYEVLDKYNFNRVVERKYVPSKYRFYYNENPFVLDLNEVAQSGEVLDFSYLVPYLKNDTCHKN